MSKPLGLAAFAKTHPARKPGPACWACNIPEREEMAEGHKSGLTFRQIREWLIQERGYDPELASRHRIADHLREHVR